MRKTALGWVAAGASAVLLLSACGGDGGGDNGGAKFNQASTEVVNASDQKGGTLRYAISSNMESTDPGNTYYGYMWNFSRYYARTLYTYAAEPGDAGREVVPDLAEGQPKVSEDGKTYTVKLKKGLKYEDGSKVVAEDVKYAIARSNFGPKALPNGPKYYKEHLANSEDYKGPYANEDDPLKGFGGIETPDDRTLVFHLKGAFYDFPYVLVQPQSSPVPPDKDTGERYQQHVVSTGPYKFEDDWTPGKGLTLVRNEHWNAETDPVRKALPDKVTVEEGVEQNEIDQRLANGELDVDLQGTGLGPAKKGEFLRDEEQKARIDTPANGAHYFLTVNTQVEPFDDIECRKAVQYAMDRTAIQRAWGGKAGGAIATQLLPPTVPGANPDSDVYASKGNKGDIDKAKAHLEECGESDGVPAKLGVRADRPSEVAAAEAIQESLKRAKIDVSIKKYPSDTFTNTQAGSPSFVHKEKMALNIYGWMPDWNTGYGYMSQIVDGDAIKEAGNANIQELDDPELNKMFDEVVTIEDEQKRTEMYTKMDKMVMESASIAPMVFHKPAFYRPDNLTNVYFNPSWKMYDYMALGTTNTE